MFVCPGETAVAIPWLSIVATPVALECQVTWLVRLTVELSLYVPVAVNVSLVL